MYAPGGLPEARAPHAIVHACRFAVLLALSMLLGRDGLLRRKSSRAPTRPARAA